MAGVGGYSDMFHATGLFQSCRNPTNGEPTPMQGDGQEHSVVIHPVAGSCFVASGCTTQRLRPSAKTVCSRRGSQGADGGTWAGAAFGHVRAVEDMWAPSRLPGHPSDSGVGRAWAHGKGFECPSGNGDGQFQHGLQQTRKVQEYGSARTSVEGQVKKLEVSGSKASAVGRVLPKDITIPCKCHQREGRSLDNMPTAHKVKYIGVRMRGKRRWVAEIKDNNHNVRKWLGTFGCPVQAAQAFDAAARAIRGPHTRANFKMGDPDYVASIADLPTEMLTEPLASLVPLAPPRELLVGEGGKSGSRGGCAAQMPCAEAQSRSSPGEDVGSGVSPSSMCTTEKEASVGRPTADPCSHAPPSCMCMMDKAPVKANPTVLPPGASCAFTGSCSSQLVADCCDSLKDAEHLDSRSNQSLACVSGHDAHPPSPAAAAAQLQLPRSSFCHGIRVVPGLPPLSASAAFSSAKGHFEPSPLRLPQDKRALGCVGLRSQSGSDSLAKSSDVTCHLVQSSPVCTEDSPRWGDCEAGNTNLMSVPGTDLSRQSDQSPSWTSEMDDLLPFQSYVVVGPDVPSGRPAVPPVQDAGAPLLFTALWLKDGRKRGLPAGRIKMSGDLGMVVHSLNSASNGDVCPAKKPKVKEPEAVAEGLQKSSSSILSSSIVRSAIQGLPRHVVEAIFDSHEEQGPPQAAWLSL